MNKKALFVAAILVGITVLGAFFRLYDLKNYPGGLFPDEAANGEDALLILEGDTRPFYPRGNGREALFFYFQALSIKTFGIGVWQMHLVPAILGTITVFAMYFANRPFFGRTAGLLAAFFLATSHWHVTLSRTGFRAMQIPLFLALFTAFVGYAIAAVKKKQIAASYVYAALAGAAFMGGFYTYIAYRVMIGVVLGILFLLFLAALHPKIGFPHVRRYGKQTVVAAIAGLLVFAPLGWYFIQHPKDIVGRAGQVSVFSKTLQDEYGGGTLLGTLAYSTRETLVSFFMPPGDLNWRHNVAGYPLLSPFVAVLFLLGLAWAIHGTVNIFYQIARGQEIHMGMVYPYLILVLSGMLLPVITTAEGMPHALRSVGLITPIFMLAGTAASVTVHFLKRRLPHEGIRSIAYGLLAGAAVLGVAYDAFLYFGIARNSSEAAYAYRSDLTEVAAYINEYASQHPEGPRPYLVLDKFSLQTVHLFTSVAAHDYLEHPDEAQHKYHSVDPATSHLTALQPGEIIIFTQSTMPTDTERYEQTYGDSLEVVESRFNRFGEEIMRVYRLKEGAENQIDEFNLDA